MKLYNFPYDMSNKYIKNMKWWFNKYFENTKFAWFYTRRPYCFERNSKLLGYLNTNEAGIKKFNSATAYCFECKTVFKITLFSYGIKEVEWKAKSVQWTFSNNSKIWRGNESAILYTILSYENLR